MPDTAPIFPNANNADMSAVTVGEVKSALGLSSKADVSTLTQEIIDRANADIALANAKLDKPTGTTEQYMRGDGSLATFPTIPPDFSITAGVVSSVTLNSAFRPSATRPALVAIIGSYTALVSGGVTLSVQASATESGAYTEVSTTNLITLLTALSNAKETLMVPVPAGHWLKVTASGGTPTVQKVIWTL